MTAKVDDLLVVSRVDAVRAIKRIFDLSAFVILMVTGLAKLISAFSGAEILDETDPLVHVSYRVLLLGLGLCEIMVSLSALGAKEEIVRYGFLCLLGSAFVWYRLMFWHLGLQQPCPCLGILGDNLPLKPELQQSLLRGIAIYLFAGSSLFLGSALWAKKKRLNA